MTIIEYPKSILVAEIEDGAYAVAESPQELSQKFTDLPVKIARYVLVGTGVLHTERAYYVEQSHA